MSSTIIKTGITALDNNLGGLTKGHLILLGGKPGLGMTSLAFSALYNCSIKQHYTCVYVTLDEPYEMLKDKFGDRIAKGNIMKVENKMYNDKTTDKLLILDAYKDTQGFYDVTEIIDKIIDLSQNGYNIGLIAIDFFEMLKKAPNESADNFYILGAIKSLAKRLGRPIIVITYVDRTCEAREDKRPTLKDLRITKQAVDKFADDVFFLYRDNFYYDNTDDKTELIIAKLDGKVKINKNIILDEYYGV